VSELVIREIDEYTDAWANEYTEACAATTVRGEQSAEVMDLRMSCLKRAKVDLDAIVEVLAEADRDVAARAHRIATGLRPLSECSDIERLRAEVVPPRPEDVAAVEGAREALATAKAESKAGRYEDALRRVEDAKVQLASVDYEPVRAEVAVLEGALFEYLGRYEDAEAALKRALGYAARTHQARILGRTGIRLMGVVGYQQRRFAVGLRYASVAHALTSHDPAADADMHNVIGNILDAQGHYADAEAEYRRALAYTVEAGEDSEPWTAAWISNLANAIDSQGRYDEAEAEHRRALKLKETILGPDHPSVALGHNNLASVLMSRGKYAEAEAEARRALEIWEQALGPDHPSVANALHNLGNAVYSQGRPADAEVFYRRGLTLLEQTLGPDHPKVGSALTNLGAAVSSSGDQEEAERLFRRALDIERSALGPEHPKLINVRISLAIVLNAQGKLDEAEAEHRAALQLALKTMGPNHPIVGNVRGNLALVLAAEGKSREAEAEFRESLRLREQRLGPEHPDVAYARFGLAKHLAAQDRIDEARSLARRALEVYIQQDRTEDAERVSTWLDEVH
jgi:serine/threonine-protein kinase